MSKFFDSHAHLDSEDFRLDLDGLLARAKAAGVTHLITIGASDGVAPNHVAVKLAAEHAPVYAAVGVHPHDARMVDAAVLAEIEALSKQPKVVAIGETGLDYHYNHSTREQQLAAFRAFIQMAKRRQLPISIHTREAEDDTLEVMKSEGASEVGGVIHCFTGTEKLAQGALELGFHISFSGVLTFKNSEPLRNIARSLPRDRVLVETDSPFLAPVPYRGKRCEPAYVIETANKLAELWGVEDGEVRRITGENAARLFRIP